MQVRRARRDEAAALAQLGSASFWGAYGGTAPEQNIAAHVDAHFSADVVSAEFDNDGVRYYVAEEGGKYAGLCKTREASRPELLGERVAREVQHLYVAPDFQRRGVGGLLLDKVVDDVRVDGLDGVWLSVWTEADWATGFYRKYGFELLGEVPFQLAGIDYVDYLMYYRVPG